MCAGAGYRGIQRPPQPQLLHVMGADRGRGPARKWEPLGGVGRRRLEQAQ